MNTTTRAIKQSPVLARPTRRLDPFGALRTDRIAAATNDLAEAQALFEDLAALLNAGLVDVVGERGAVRYVAAETTHTTNSPAEPVTDRRSP